ncbi:probable ATP-dependent RNA helicase DDX10 isoform X1 [Varroa jacobsoni]|uniref:probable ATP-dependent RNA helicase DDX10 isoform X1 n=1 Tax=Varroa jacobsoni TaxID=62625 RepID=UPI000BF77F40|nr:probable ATP-dependent RNA helicase DDX10 isoform X1 [Varroa jacobsoni]
MAEKKNMTRKNESISRSGPVISDRKQFSNSEWPNSEELEKGDGGDNRPPNGKRNNKFEKKKSGKPFRKREATSKIERDEINELKKLYGTFNFDILETFRDAPLCVRTKAALERCGYEKPTRIQKETLALALRGRDVLGAAKTGSGKTLAFLIPVLELLFREMWTRLDGLGALIITPTRELAYQIFEVLKKVGARHDFSAGLIIGGTEVGFERKRLHGTNIMICTPGRLLQHMDQNPLLDPTNLKVLVLDEADRILDMGFEKEMNAILENLPSNRQTLLFSATQTKSVKDLARLSLTNPCYISVHEKAEQVTPDRLHQNYLVCELHDKLSLLWSFLKNHRSKKIIVFMSCCKQVQFINTIIRRLRPGTTVMHLHGNMSQPRRLAIYEEFCSKQSAILLATDLAARGLDFPKVDWVLQLDCPEDPQTYIHRVGRTARFENAGKALLVLLPSEEDKMIKQLVERKIPISKIAVNPRRFYDIQRKVEAMCARDAELKASAQRCFVGYLKYVFVQKDKAVFSVEKLGLDFFARSLGLIITPRVRFLEKYFAAKGIKMSGQMESDQARTGNSEDDSKEFQKDDGKPKMIQLSKKIEKFSFDIGIDTDEEIFTEKGKPFCEIDTNEIKEDSSAGSDEEKNEKESTSILESLEQQIRVAKTNKVITKIQAAKKVLRKKHIVLNKKVVFDEQGQRVDNAEDTVLSKPLAGVDEKGGINIELSKQLMQEQDRIDKQIYREKIKNKHREERLKAKAERRATAIGGDVVLDIGCGGGECGGVDSDSEKIRLFNQDQYSSLENEDSASVNSENESLNGKLNSESSYSESETSDSEKQSTGTMDENDKHCIGFVRRKFKSGDRKRFIRKQADSSASEEIEENEDDHLPTQHVPKKQMKTKGKFGLKRRRIEEDVDELDTGLSLQGDEKLALKLLQDWG